MNTDSAPSEMAKTSRFMGRIVLLTSFALFLAALSLSMFWFHSAYACHSSGVKSWGEDRFAAKYWTFEWEQTDGRSYLSDETFLYSQNYSPMYKVMLYVQILVVLWFLVATLFIGLCLRDDRLASIVVGAILIVTSAGTMLFFVLSVPNALHLPGFIGTSSDGTGGSQTYGPLAGFWCASAAAVLQISAAIMRIRVVRTAKRETRPNLKSAESAGKAPWSGED
jgi:hypothetical protein